LQPSAKLQQEDDSVDLRLSLDAIRGIALLCLRFASHRESFDSDSTIKSNVNFLRVSSAIIPHRGLKLRDSNSNFSPARRIERSRNPSRGSTIIARGAFGIFPPLKPQSIEISSNYLISPAPLSVSATESP